MFFELFLLVERKTIDTISVLIAEGIGNIVLVNGFDYTRCGEVF